MPSGSGFAGRAVHIVLAAIASATWADSSLRLDALLIGCLSRPRSTPLAFWGLWMSLVLTAPVVFTADRDDDVENAVQGSADAAARAELQRSPWAWCTAGGLWSNGGFRSLGGWFRGLGLEEIGRVSSFCGRSCLRSLMLRAFRHDIVKPWSRIRLQAFMSSYCCQLFHLVLACGEQWQQRALCHCCSLRTGHGPG